MLWSTRLVKTGVQRAFGDQLRTLLQRATENRVRACGLGIIVATALQSSTATALLLVSFATRGLIALGPALAVMLGADIGSTLVVQALSFDLKGFVPVLLVGGVAAFMMSGDSTIRQSGRIVIGLALMILSLGMIVGTSAGMREHETITYLLGHLGNEPVLSVIFVAGLTWLLHSSVAMVLFIMALAGATVITLPLGLTLLLGANIGAGLIPLGLGWREPQSARRILVGNLAFRVIGALVVLALLSTVSAIVLPAGQTPARAIASTHMIFNIALALVFLPFTERVAALLERLLPDDPGHDASSSRPLHLDEALLDQPALALGAASREVMRLAERVEAMLSDTIHTFSDTDDKRRLGIRKLDDEVDALQEAIKLYLTRLTRQPLSEADARRAFDLILFTTNLEAVGDIIDKNLLELAAKRQRHSVSFSAAGWSELTDFHARIVRQMQLAMTVFMTKDVTMARELVAEKDQIATARDGAALRSWFPHLTGELRQRKIGNWRYRHVPSSCTRSFPRFARCRTGCL